MLTIKRFCLTVYMYMPLEHCVSFAHVIRYIYVPCILGICTILELRSTFSQNMQQFWDCINNLRILQWPSTISRLYKIITQSRDAFMQCTCYNVHSYWLSREVPIVRAASEMDGNTRKLYNSCLYNSTGHLAAQDCGRRRWVLRVRKRFNDYCNQRFGKDGPHCSKTIMRVKGQQSSMEPSSSSGWGSKVFSWWHMLPLAWRMYSAFPWRTKSVTDIIFERRGKQSILKRAYFTNTYNYRTQWPNNLSSWRWMAFVKDFFDILKDIHCMEKGILEARKPLRRYMHLMWHF